MNQVQRQLQENIGDNLRKLRKQEGLTQIQLAKKAGINRSHLLEIENGRANVTLSTLVALAKVFSLPAHSLLFPAPK